MLYFDLINYSSLLISQLRNLITDVCKLIIKVSLANGHLSSQIRNHLCRLVDSISEEADFAFPGVAGGFA